MNGALIARTLDVVAWSILATATLVGGYVAPWWFQGGAYALLAIKAFRRE